jgi:hypothetical protein
MCNIEILLKLTHKHPKGLEFTKIRFKLYSQESGAQQVLRVSLLEFGKKACLQSRE